MRKWYRNDARIAEKADKLLKDIYTAFGWKTRIIAPLIGRYTLRSLKKEEERLARGWTYEPSCFYEKNSAAKALERGGGCKTQVKGARKTSCSQSADSKLWQIDSSRTSNERFHRSDRARDRAAG